MEEYSKRLGRYCKLTITELADEDAGQGKSCQERQIKEKEGERILKALSDGAYVIALAIEGKTLSSRQLAKPDGTSDSTGRKPLSFYHRRFPGAG